MVLVMTLAFAFYTLYLLVQFWASRLVLFQTLHLKAQVFQLRVDLLNFLFSILYWGLVQPHYYFQGFVLSR